ncbi:MAG: hypothetical protein ACI4O6_03660 [Dysosmobacter sp.]
MDGKSWNALAFEVAAEAAKEPHDARRRWRGQCEWDRDNMVTESTRFPVDTDLLLEAYCWQAGVTRYTLINYLLRAWMAAWETYGENR